MMYANPIPNPDAGATKYIVIFMLIIIAGAGILFTLASGNFGPEAAARANRIETQTEIEKEKQLASLQYQKAEQQQRLEQAARDFELSLTLKEWGTRVFTLGVTIALTLAALILAGGKSYQWVVQAQSARSAVSAQAASSITEQPAQPSVAPAETVRMREIYALLSKMDARLEALEHQVTNTQSQVMATQRRLEQLEIHGNGSDPNKIIPFKSAVG
jgi:TolA-binding protein